MLCSGVGDTQLGMHHAVLKEVLVLRRCSDLLSCHSEQEGLMETKGKPCTEEGGGLTSGTRPGSRKTFQRCL